MQNITNLKKRLTEMRKNRLTTAAFCLAMALSLAMTACGNGGKAPAGETEKDSTELTAATDYATGQVAQETESQEEVPVAGIGDLAAYELRGKVKTCKWKGEHGTETTYTFDQEGHLTKIDSNQASDIFSELKRDKQGRLLSYVAGDFDCYEASRYTYDSTSGLLKTISNECPDSGSDVTTYIYDNKGYAVKMEVKGSRGEMGEEPEPYESTKTFTYDGFDSKGNWTLRKGKDSTEKTEWTETRVITYFE